MARVSTRRPLPALAFLLGLSVLTALVWMRVWNRTADDDTAGPTGTSTCAVQADVALPAPETVTVRVLNSTDRARLAATVSGQLTERGFVVAGVDDDSPTVSGVAEIRFGTSGKPGATLLSFYFPGSVLVPTATIADASVTVSLGAGFQTSIASADQVTAAIAAAKTEASKPGNSAKGC